MQPEPPATASPDAGSPPREDISGLAGHLFRHEAGKLVSVLTGIFGMERLQLAEDVVQEALVRAMQTWPYYGIPKNPAAWLTQTAKHLALDVVRREKVFREKEPAIAASIEQWPAESLTGRSPAFEDEIQDDRLRLMFACCHPQLPAEAQTALALKTLCGFSPAEIAKAFLTTEAAIAKRLTRARQRLHELHVRFEIPAGEELATRLEGVLQTLYLLFNEGYKASMGDNLLREELCSEAIRLATLLAGHRVSNQPRTHALLALMLLNTARLASRVDTSGNVLRLKEQNRATWDKAMIARGLWHFSQSASGSELSEYHLQAGIAACHCAAPEYEATDWRQILSLYDLWMERTDSPVVALNRAVAVAQVHGPQAGLDAIGAIREREMLESYYLYYSVMAEFETELEDYPSAASHLRLALKFTEVKSERAFLTKRLEENEQRKAAAAR